MKISYKFFNINNLNYKFNQKAVSGEKVSETYHFNIESTTVTSNRENKIALIELKIKVNTELDGVQDIFRSLTFDFNYIYQIEDFENLSDEEIQKFMVNHGLESAISAVKDVIKNITSIDYQPTINIDIPKFPMDMEMRKN